MNRRPSRHPLPSPFVLHGSFGFCLAFCVVFLASRFAFAAPNDTAAQKLRDQAIEQDYLALNFAAAEKKMTDALALCKKTTDCSPFVRARVHCDLGVIEFMLHRVDLARTELATALMEDPNVALDANLSNSDVIREFAAVKGGGSSAGDAGAAPEGAEAGTAQAIQSGGIVHTPPPRQATQTPIPLYVEVAQDVGVARVVLRYRPAGARDWKTLPMRTFERGFGVEVPCADVGDKEGAVEYYVQALDGNGDIVGFSGKSDAPQRVAIVKKLDGEPPHFPGQTPPHACAAPSAPAQATGALPPSPAGGVSAEGAAATTIPEASDCPPGLPGCHSEPTTCESNDDCAGSEVCTDRVCQRPEEERRDFKKNWVSLALQAELLVMPGADDACRGGQGYTCFLSSSGEHLSQPPVAGRDDKVVGGFATSPMLRVLLGYDRAVSPHWMLGARVGAAVLGSARQRPGGAAFMPVHAEARAAYYFGKNALVRRGLRPYLLFAGGLTEIDATQTIDVLPTPGASRVNIDASTKTGLGFGTLGGGLLVAVTPSSGPFVEAKAVLLFPTFGGAVAAQAGYALGF